MPKDTLHGTLDALVLKTLTFGPRHGYAIVRWISQQTADALQVEEGSLYPALYRLEARHLERTVGRLVARGLTRGEAEKRRAGKFGNVALHEEHGRDARAAHWRALRRGRLPMR